MIRFAAVAVMLALTACSPSTKEACIAQFAQVGKTQQVVRAGYAQCTIAFDDKQHEILRERAMCIAQQLPSVNVDQGLRVVASECTTQHPTPDCPVGQRFDFGNDVCSDICQPDELYQPGQYPECVIDASKVKWDP